MVFYIAWLRDTHPSCLILQYSISKSLDMPPCSPRYFYTISLMPSSSNTSSTCLISPNLYLSHYVLSHPSPCQSFCKFTHESRWIFCADRKNSKTINKDLCYIKEKVINQPNVASTSLCALKRILRIKFSDIYDHHACPSECMSFPYLPKKEWLKHIHDKCWVCHAYRFHVLKNAAKSREPEARMKLYVFGLSSTIIR